MRLPSAVAVMPLAVALLAGSGTAEAVVTATKAPVTNVLTTQILVPPGHRFEFCPGTTGGPPDPDPIPLEWDVIIQNSDEVNPVTVIYNDDVNDHPGSADAFHLQCPPTLLPAGVTPADVSCNAAAGTLQIRNITIQPCSRVVLRFETIVGPDGVALTTLCDKGTVSQGLSTIDSVTPIADQVPAGPETCFFVNSMCNMSDTMNIRTLGSVTDVNGPPLLPGDLVHIKTWMDLRYLEILPSFQLRYLHANSNGNSIPLPIGLEYVQWLDTPLSATADYTSAARQVNITERIATPTNIPTGGIRDLGRWEGQVQCNVAPSTPLCLTSLMQHAFGSQAIDDPFTLGKRPDTNICVIPTQPDFSTSTKTVNAGGDGLAQPGELITFTINVTNSALCPVEKLDCECQATEVEILDLVDLSKLQDIVILDGGTPGANPDEAEWSVARLAPGGRPGNTTTVRLQARVRNDVVDGSQICNTAYITSAELKSVAEGGLLNCPSETPTEISLSPCVTVAIPQTPLLTLNKAFTAPVAEPLPIGTVVTYTVTVTNVGGAAATAVDVWDCLNPTWDDILAVPLDGGVRNPADARCGGGPSVSWPQIASLAGNGGSQAFRFEITVPPGLADGVLIPNRGNTIGSNAPAAASNQPQVEICAPDLTFEKTLPKNIYAEGERIEWTLTLTNDGRCPASNIQLTDLLDVAILDEATIQHVDPPGSVGTYDAPSDTMSWSLATLDGNGKVIEFKVSGVILAGTTPGPVCNTGSLRWNEGLTSITSGAPTCASIQSGCAAPAAIEPLLGVKAGLGKVDAYFEWPGGAVDFRVCRIDGYANKAEIAVACENSAVANSVAGCDPTSALNCTDLAPAPPAGGVFYYQVKGLCSGLEGP